MDSLSPQSISASERKPEQREAKGYNWISREEFYQNSGNDILTGSMERS
jgi:hypothetical protein